MIAAVLVGVGLLGALDGLPDVAADRAAYEAARGALGHDSKAHVGLALWCEQHGLTAERLKHLAIAVLIDPKDASARGLMGLVSYRGEWRSPERVSEQVAKDEQLAARLAEYNARRQRTAETADAQWKLGLWCAENGLEAEAQAHFTAVTRLDPSREVAWKRLGCKKVGGRWVSDAQLASEKAETEARKKADQKYRPLLAKWRAALAGRDPAKRAEAEAALDALTDPRAVPAVWATFAGGDGRAQQRAVQLLGRLEGPDASRALAALAVFSPSAEVRRAATETLRHRDLREVVGWLIGLIGTPLQYEVRPVGGPGSPGVLFVENERFNLQRVYAPPSLPDIPLFPGEPITFDAAGLPVVSRLLGNVVIQGPSSWSQRLANVSRDQYFGRAPTDAATAELIREAKADRTGGTVVTPQNRVRLTQNTTTTTTAPGAMTLPIPIGQIALQYETAAMVAQARLASDLQAVERFNAGINAWNEGVLDVLRGVTGHDERADRNAWAHWWTDEQGYAYTPPSQEPKPTVVENVPLDYTPDVRITPQVTQTGPSTIQTTTTTSSHSCFRSGTSVRTLAGPKAIEKVAVGDQVLVQDLHTGVLGYHPVLTAFHNRPALLYKLDLGGETVWATGIHRFWKAGQGWVMARDLKPDDRLRTIGGTATVNAVSEGPVEPVFNLEVAAGQSFFVGKAGVLVHDNSLVEPVTEPFDAVPAQAPGH